MTGTQSTPRDDEATDSAIPIIYGAALFMGTGYGVSAALIALRFSALGFSKLAIGSLAAVNACGIVLASLPMGAVIRRFSLKTVLVVSLAGYAACIGLFPFLDSGLALVATRFLDGVCSVATWIGFETVLLHRARAHKRAYTMSHYAIALALGYLLGPLLARGIGTVAPVAMAFLASSVLAIAASILVARRLDGAAADRPIADEVSGLSVVSAAPFSIVLRRIRMSLFGTFAYGYFQASVVLFLPLYLIERKGVSASRTVLLPAFFAAGMLLFSTYASKVGDRVGHLKVMRTLAAIGALTVVGFVWLASWPLICATVFVAGATLAPISPVSLALQGLVVDAGSYGRATSLYNGFYAAGILLGPPVSSLIFANFGGGAMLWHLAALWAIFAALAIVFWKDDPAAQVGRRLGARQPYPAIPTDSAAP